MSHNGQAHPHGDTPPMSVPLRARTDAELAEELEAQAEAEPDPERATLLRSAARLLSPPPATVV